MAKRLISLAIFTFLLSIFFGIPSKTFALTDAATIGDRIPGSDAVKEYCKLRSGNQMNLETWYSGKCTGSFQERLGFADMVWLDLWSDSGQSANSSTSFLPLGI